MKDRIPVLNPWDGQGVPPRPPGQRQRKAAWRRALSAVARFLRHVLVRKSSVVMPTVLDVRGYDAEFSFTTPAQGEAYTFDIQVRCTWRIRPGTDHAEHRRAGWEVLDFVERSRAVAQARLEERIRPAARQFPAYQAAEAEERLNRVVAGCFDDEDGRSDVQVTIQVQVGVCDDIRSELGEKWKKRLENVVADQWHLAHVQTLRDLQEEWRKLLVAGLEGIGALPPDKTEWLAPYALALAENPKDAAGQLRSVLTDRVGQAETLLKNLGQVSLDDRMDALEFAFQSETTLRALLVYLGVPVPTANGSRERAAGQRIPEP